MGACGDFRNQLVNLLIIREGLRHLLLLCDTTMMPCAQVRENGCCELPVQAMAQRQATPTEAAMHLSKAAWAAFCERGDKTQYVEVRLKGLAMPHKRPSYPIHSALQFCIAQLVSLSNL